MRCVAPPSVTGKTGYAKYGCRCSRCRADYSAYKRAWRARGGRGVAREREASRAYKERNREAVKAWERAYQAAPENRGECEVCEGPMGVGSRSDGICRSCRLAARNCKWAEIQSLWNEGYSIRDICRELGGVSVGYLGGEMCRMRSEGWDLPYRYNIGNRRAAA